MQADCMYNEREIFNIERGEAKCSIENFEFIVQSGSACICKHNTNLKSLTHLIYNLSSLLACKYCTPFVNKTNKKNENKAIPVGKKHLLANTREKLKG